LTGFAFGFALAPFLVCALLRAGAFMECVLLINAAAGRAWRGQARTHPSAGPADETARRRNRTTPPTSLKE
jgi:hypothetical protein